MTRPSPLPKEDRVGWRDVIIVLMGLVAAILLYRLAGWSLSALHRALHIDVPPSEASSIVLTISLGVLITGSLFDRRGLWRRIVAVPVQLGLVVAVVLGDLAAALMIGWLDGGTGGYLKEALSLTPLILLPGAWLLACLTFLARSDRTPSAEPAGGGGK